MKTMHWDDVRYFLTLAQQGSLSATARVLQVEHSTVARRVSHLEQTLQLKLFDRLARSWVLTPEGQHLFEQAQCLAEDMQTLQRAALGQARLAGRIRLSLPPILLNWFLLPHFQHFKQQYPDIELSLLGERHSANIGHGEADIALRIREPAEPGLIAKPLANIHYDLYATPAHLALPLTEQGVILLEPINSSTAQRHWLQQQLGERRSVLRTNDFATAYHAAQQGWGIAFLPKLLAQHSPSLQALDGLPPAPVRALYLVMHPDVKRAPRIRLMVDFLVEVFEQHGEAL